MQWDYENEQWTSLPGHMKHLPLFTRHLDMVSLFFRLLWALFLKLAFNFYVRLSIKGDLKKVLKENPKLLIISNHASHIDAVSIAAAIPFSAWKDLYMAAAKDYWFKNPLFTFFSKHCLGAIPIDRKDKTGEAVKLCISLLTKLDKIWMILFPEGSRSKSGYIQRFKRGVSIFSQKTNTPILFLYLDGNAELMPKGSLPRPGKLVIHVGPVQPPAPIEEVDKNYREWVTQINPNAYKPLLSDDDSEDEEDSES